MAEVLKTFPILFDRCPRDGKELSLPVRGLQPVVILLQHQSRVVFPAVSPKQHIHIFIIRRYIFNLCVLRISSGDPITTTGPGGCFEVAPGTSESSQWARLELGKSWNVQLIS